MRQHDPRDLYVLGMVHRLLDLKVGHPISEYKDIFLHVSVLLQDFIGNPFNREHLPNAVDTAATLNAFITPLAKTDSDFVLDAAFLEKTLREGSLVILNLHLAST